MSTTEINQSVLRQLDKMTDLVDIQDIAPVAFSAERLKPGSGSQLQLGVSAAAAPTEQSLSYKFDLSGTIQDDDDVDVATFAISMVITYVPRSASPEVAVPDDAESLKAFGDYVAWREVYPYLREGMQTVLARLRIHGFQLPMVRPQDGLIPDTMN
ncbi:hypothetical protein AB0I81_17780 [Nonomuraea sp. NPDC050404]|uniref:hypothetical protein n=1 Tax=Nonomuraea sp. NPDC050404 TaxID=3155783 RepID=UPI003406B291